MSTGTATTTHARRRGSVLILSLGVLALFAALALTVTLTLQLERQATANYVDGNRARLIAKAGIERAAAELTVSELRNPTGVPVSPWTYGVRGVPLDLAVQPSYARPADELGPCSGVLGGTYVPAGDRYALRVLDTSSLLDLGADRVILGPALDALGRAIRVVRARGGDPEPRDPIQGRGATIVAQLAVLGHRAQPADLVALLGPLDGPSVRDYVTGHAELDLGTVSLPGQKDVRGVPIAESRPRAPVSVNTAPLPVLVAVFANVTGRDGVPVSFDAALAVADRLDAWRRSRDVTAGPFKTWASLARFFESELPACGLTPGQREAILANASPFLALEELNPDSSALMLGSRSAVKRGTTELSLLTSGVFEVTARGWLTGPNGEVVADACESALVRVFEVERHRTQADFALGQGDRTLAGSAPPETTPLERLGYVQLDPVAAAGLGLSLAFNGKKPMLASKGGALASLTSPRLDATTLEPRGPLHLDGYKISPCDERSLTFALPCEAPAAEGRMAFWLKAGAPATDVVLVEATRTLAAHEGVRHQVRVTQSRDRLQVASERRVVREAGFGPQTRAAASLATSAPVEARPHEWHRVEVVWSLADQTLYVDGRSCDGAPLAQGVDIGKPSNVLALGGEVNGVATGGDATIDGFLIDGVPQPTKVTDRYWAEDRTIGTFHGNFHLTGGRLRLGTIGWTAFSPRRWGAVEFRPDEFTIVATVLPGTSSVVVGTAEGTPIRLHGEGGDDDGEGDDGGGDDGGGGGGGGGGGSSSRPSGTTGGSGGGRSTLSSHGGRSASSVTTVSATTGDLTSTSGPAGGPTVVQIGTGGAGQVADIAYDFAFIYDRAAIAARGLVPPPVAVTPVLQEVYMTYSRGTRIDALEGGRE